MSLFQALQSSGRSAFQRIEHLFDAAFGGANPLRHLGALGFFFYWLIAVGGLYLYAVLDTSIEGINASVNHYTQDQWYLYGILRSLHRYAADGFVIVMVLHAVREFLYGRWHGFRRFSWMTGVPVIWLVYASGIGGYWLVWDRLGQFSAVASAEWFDWLPFVNNVVARNFITNRSVSDRFFSLLVFLHIGIPLLLLLALWAHIQRVSRADVFPPRRLALGTLATLVALALLDPTVSHGAADLSTAPALVHIDWFYLFVHPLMYATSPGDLWAFAGLATLALFLLPFLPHPRPQPVAQVHPSNCNGCGRCFDDCPYGAIVMEPHPDKPGHSLATVVPELCGACGICAGACPSSTPFRSLEELVSGIDMPQRPVGVLRRELERKIAQLTDGPRIVVFGCDCAAHLASLEDNRTTALSLLCTGMLPPSFAEYALRAGADGVLVTGCREGGCIFRLGNRWAEERLAARREPHLRANVSAHRIRIAWADPRDGQELARVLSAFHNELQTLTDADTRPRRFIRRIVNNG